LHLGFLQEEEAVLIGFMRSHGAAARMLIQHILIQHNLVQHILIQHILNQMKEIAGDPVSGSQAVGGQDRRVWGGCVIHDTVT
jgi:hypothetical protein